MPTTDENYAQRVRELNDLFRTTFIGGRIVMTEGIGSLPEDDQAEILSQVRGFTDFNEGNDPHREHDFGAFAHQGRKVFFKIDYYDPRFSLHSEDASDPKKTRRVLTIMLAEEY